MTTLLRRVFHSWHLHIDRVPSGLFTAALSDLLRPQANISSRIDLAGISKKGAIPLAAPLLAVQGLDQQGVIPVNVDIWSRNHISA